jgi:flagellar biogenesis protein FliO
MRPPSRQFHVIAGPALAGLTGPALAGLAGAVWLSGAALAGAQTAAPATGEALSAASAAASLVRVIGALALVVGVFLGGVWLYRNWQRLTTRNVRAPRLNVLEVRPLGHRHALYVVAYEQQRLLLAASPAGVSMLIHLPPAGAGEPEPGSVPHCGVNFADALLHAAGRTR